MDLMCLIVACIIVLVFFALAIIKLWRLTPEEKNKDEDGLHHIKEDGVLQWINYDNNKFCPFCGCSAITHRSSSVDKCDRCGAIFLIRSWIRVKKNQ